MNDDDNLEQEMTQEMTFAIQAAFYLYHTNNRFREIANRVGTYMYETGTDIRLVGVAAVEVLRELKSRMSDKKHQDPEAGQMSGLERTLRNHMELKQAADKDRERMRLAGMGEGDGFVLEVMNNTVVGTGSAKLPDEVVVWLRERGITVPDEFTT